VILVGRDIIVEHVFEAAERGVAEVPRQRRQRVSAQVAGAAGRQRGRVRWADQQVHSDQVVGGTRQDPRCAETAVATGCASTNSAIGKVDI